MDFRTQVELPKYGTEIRHSDRIMLFGSCFAENIGNLLLTHKFVCDVNPLGILYNPSSVAEAIRQIHTSTTYTEADLFFAEGRWHSYMHHSSFSAPSAHQCLDRINRRLEKASKALPQSHFLVLTWGTAWVYTEKETHRVVGNCHKQPDRLFDRRLLSVDEIVSDYVALLDELHALNPHLKVIVTVSPIRHIKDGMHGNQLSKSTLLLAADKICSLRSQCTYFPSYEIMMDELRDYRFYADDMLHPSPVAISYLWNCFSETYFTNDTTMVMQEWAKISKGLKHRPFDAQSEAHRTFLTQIVLKIQQLKEKFPYFDVQKELEQCQEQLDI